MTKTYDKMVTLTSEQQNSLEKMLDQTSLSGILESLSEICYLKAQHIQDNWPNTGSASLVRAWFRAGNKLEADAAKSIITAVS